MKKEEWFAQAFAKYEKKYDVPGHSLPALYDAVRFAHANAVPLTERTAREVLNLIIERYNVISGRKRSRLTRYKRDYKHYRRWLALSNAFKIYGIEYSKKSGRPKTGENGAIKDAREHARRRLEGTVARTDSVRQIQDSFDLVEKRRAAGDGTAFSFD
jgi:hypothetical protein